MKILIAGGGTGGHIYPALAIAKAVQNLDANSVVEFVGTSRGLESKIIPDAGYQLHLVDIGRLNKNAALIERIKTLLMAPFAVVKSLFLILKLKPDVVLGVGGFASGPLVLAAALLRKNTFIWEPNAYPGMANRWLAPLVKSCLVVFSEAARHLNAKRILQVQMPVREEIENVSDILSSDEPHAGEFRILLFGGSQGARSLNNALSEAIILGGEWLTGVQIVHQTGPYDFERIQNLYLNSTHAKEHVQVFEYLNDMPDRYSWADLVISRAGTGTLSELEAIGKIAILVPLPSAADDHQTKNAMAWVAQGGGRLLAQSELTPSRLVHEILSYKSQVKDLKASGELLRKRYKPGAAKRIAEILLKSEE